MIRLELYIAIPKGFCDIIVGWSSLVLKKIIVHNGVIDSDYHGIVCVIHVQYNGFFYKEKKLQMIVNPWNFRLKKKKVADNTFCPCKPEKRWKSSCKPEEKWETLCHHVKVMTENVFLNISFEK